MKVRKLWIPYPSAWMSALLLLLLTGMLTYGATAVFDLGSWLSRISPNLSLLLAIAALLTPMVLIAIAHHVLHLCLDCFFPDSKVDSRDANSGFFPGLMSWWEGMYGWFVIVLTTLLTLGILGSFTATHFDYYRMLYDLLRSWDKTRHFFTIPSFLWLVIAAYLYHFEFLVHRHLMSLTPHK